MTIETDIDDITTEDRDESRFRALESRALKGTYFIVAFYGMGLGMRFAGSIVLTRLFAPDLFGILTLLTTIIVDLKRTSFRIPGATTKRFSTPCGRFWCCAALACGWSW